MRIKWIKNHSRSFGKFFLKEFVSRLLCEKTKIGIDTGSNWGWEAPCWTTFWRSLVSKVKRKLLTCTYVLSKGVLRTRGLRPRFALHVLKNQVEIEQYVSKQRRPWSDAAFCLPTLCGPQKERLTYMGFFWGSFELFMSCICHTFASVHCCLVVTCWERAHLFAFVCEVKLCFYHFNLRYPVSGAVTWLYRFLIFAAVLTLSGPFPFSIISSHIYCHSSAVY